MPSLIDKDYIINVGPQSTFRKSGKYQTLPEDIDKIFESYESDGKQVRKITLYFHGGLVDEASGLNAARNIAPHILRGESEPICFVWETGLIETLSTNFKKIGETKLFNKLLKLLLKKVSQKVGFDSPAGRGTGMGLSKDAIEQELLNEVPFESYDHIVISEAGRGGSSLSDLEVKGMDLEREFKEELEREIDLDPEFQDIIAQTKLSVNEGNNNDGSRGIIPITTFVVQAAKVLYRIVNRFIKKRDHGIYPTIVEEILRTFYIAELGAWIWKSMKDKSYDMWKSNTGKAGLDQYVGRYFLDRLALFKQRHPDAEINLIGHSAGSIAICNLLEAASALDYKIEFNHVILMAPACRTELFNRAITSRPERFKDIRIFTMSDKRESQDILVPYLYTRSLLYLISGILEDEGESFDAPLLGLERHIACLPPYDTPDYLEHHRYIYDTAFQRVCFSDTQDGTPGGLETTALKHGDFDEDQATQRSITYILTH